MKVSALVASAALVTSATAAPFSISDILGGLLTPITNDLSKILSGLQIVARTNGSAHGVPVPFNQGSPGPISSTPAGPDRFSHTINWPVGVNNAKFIDWRTYKANGVNLGGWLEKEKGYDLFWWDSHSPDTADEWNFCLSLGDKCGPILEERYASYVNTSTIDQLASVGVNTLRIPTTYAAWIKFPGSALYSGNQQAYLNTIVKYAIERYNMHIILGLHSLPGGVNSLDIDEALGHDGWFFNSTNLDFSFKAIDALLAFVVNTGHVNAFSIAPINEPADNVAGFGTPNGITVNGTNWLLTYYDGVLKKIAKIDKRIPMVVQDGFAGPSYWAPLFDARTNIVIDTHVYYFFAAGTYSQYVLPTICGQGDALNQSQSRFPVFVGEWSLQVYYNNSLGARKGLFDTQRYAWEHYLSGGCMWNVHMYTNATVDGQGPQSEYWSYIDMINEGVITTQTNSSYC